MPRKVTISESMLYNDIEQLLSDTSPSYEAIPAGTEYDPEVEFDEEDICKWLAS